MKQITTKEAKQLIESTTFASTVGIPTGYNNGYENEYTVIASNGRYYSKRGTFILSPEEIAKRSIRKIKRSGNIFLIYSNYYNIREIYQIV